ncbi:STAS domain-containing protein [Geitlerinema sp. PCC 9228]|uniref:STAS domain-containing protein n=1 Tax=Geitlerinema sp. PCC 9228 TaxID=111611 RepID=UPI0008F9CC88|nr:STAS domain-containing protein [Geitlerinema sp. PCC 9228]
MKAEVQFEVIQPTDVLNGPNTAALRKQVQACLEKGVKLVLIDLQDVTFMDSAGLGSLVTILKSVRSAQGKLCLCSVNAQIRMLFELTGMDKVFQIYRDREAFNQNVLSQNG